ncbi:MAG: hypothetical protein ACOYL5_07600 [Phototrophicaceae bacterium]|jgi:hypothetical protein
MDFYNSFFIFPLVVTSVIFLVGLAAVFGQGNYKYTPLYNPFSKILLVNFAGARRSVKQVNQVYI